MKRVPGWPLTIVIAIVILGPAIPARAQSQVRPAWRNITTGEVVVGPKMSYEDALVLVAETSTKDDVGSTWIQWRAKLWIFPLWIHKTYFSKLQDARAGDYFLPAKRDRQRSH